LILHCRFSLPPPSSLGRTVSKDIDPAFTRLTHAKE
jgi:hypothetical protein